MSEIYNEQEEADAQSRSFYEIPLQSELEAMSEVNLAELQTKFSIDKPGRIVIENEWRRRERLYQFQWNQKLVEIQHGLNQELVKLQNEFNRKLSGSQNKATLLAGVFGIVGAIIGAFLTVILTKF